MRGWVVAVVGVFAIFTVCFHGEKDPFMLEIRVMQQLDC